MLYTTDVLDVLTNWCGSFPIQTSPFCPPFFSGKNKEEEEKGSPISHYLDLGIMSVYLDFVTQIM